MTKTKFWLSILAISAVLIAGSLAVSPIAIADDDDDDDDSWYIVESEQIGGLSNAYPFIDTTPKQVVVGHVAVVDATASCTGPITGTSPSTVVVVAGVAGSLVNPLTTVELLNTGIPAGAGMCIFHADIAPGLAQPFLTTLPGKITDIAITPSATVAAGATITVSAEVTQ